MIRKIQQRLFIFIIAAALITVVWLLLIQLTLQRDFLDYINQDEESSITAALIQAYRQTGSWEFLKNPSVTWPDNLELVLPSWEIMARLTLLDARRNPVIGDTRTIPENEGLTPILDQGRILGYHYLRHRTKIIHPSNLQFLKSQRNSILIISGPILFLSMLLSLLAARRFLQPINALARGVHSLSKGQYAIRVPTNSVDELGQLTNDFNALALVLENNEKVRQQLVADIAHDLRTPLTILRGELKALLDGIRPTSREAIESLNAEVLHLTRMVDDLYTLSLYDISALSYDKTPMAPTTLLAAMVDLIRPQFIEKGITLTYAQPPPPAAVMFADGKRLRQLFTNLLDNSLRYTDAHGRLEVIAEYRPHAVTFRFQDSPPAVPSQDLSRIFDRLYRVESSRNRASGGTGLGLAICRSIVNAHEGTIVAGPSPLGGVMITVTLPVV